MPERYNLSGSEEQEVKKSGFNSISVSYFIILLLFLIVNSGNILAPLYKFLFVI